MLARILISRRGFLAITTAVMLSPAYSTDREIFPASLDHVILGACDLDLGIKFFEDHTGIRASFGGVHPDRGTTNALVSLGEHQYLEIMAPDPKGSPAQSSFVEQVNKLKNLTTPRLVGWAIHTHDIEALSRRLSLAGIAYRGPSEGSRVRPDGGRLKWKTLNLADNQQGLLPFFIEWSTLSLHPSTDSPPGCHIQQFSISHRDAEELSTTLQKLGIDFPVEHARNTQLKIQIAGPGGVVELTT